MCTVHLFLGMEPSSGGQGGWSVRNYTNKENEFFLLHKLSVDDNLMNLFHCMLNWRWAWSLCISCTGSNNHREFTSTVTLLCPEDTCSNSPQPLGLTILTLYLHDDPWASWHKTLISHLCLSVYVDCEFLCLAIIHGMKKLLCGKVWALVESQLPSALSTHLNFLIHLVKI